MVAPRIGREMLYLSREDVAGLGVGAAEMNEAMAAVFPAKAEGCAWSGSLATVTARPAAAASAAKASAVARRRL